MPKKLYGSQTERAIANFPISGWNMPSTFITTLALIKEHAAIVNGDLGEISKGMSKKIATAARSIKKGKHLDQFPVDIFQTGSGTSTNMNMNEVLAGIANGGRAGLRPAKFDNSVKSTNFEVHPNDHVNRCQSSNDVIPTALQISCLLKTRDVLFPAIEELTNQLEIKSEEFHDIIKTGRTHLMDAVPVRLGDEFNSYSALLNQSKDSIEYAMDCLCVLPLGGTAVGTGVNTHPKFAKNVIMAIRKETEFPLTEVEDHIAVQSCPLVLKTFSSSLGVLSVALMKIANDIRLMSSGPISGFGEIALPELQKGSSIMPGKVNPVLCESVEQVCFWIQGMEVTITNAVSQASRFELCTAYPLMAGQLLTGVDLLSNVMNTFSKKCVRGIKANTKKINSDLVRNQMLVTALAKEIGYEEAGLIANESIKTGDSIIEVAQRRTEFKKSKLEKLLDPYKMI